MAMTPFVQLDSLFIRAGSKKCNAKMAEVSETVKILLGLVGEESVARSKRGQEVTRISHNGISWVVNKGEKGFEVRAYRLQHDGSTLREILFNSQYAVKTPFEEIDSLVASLPAFMNGFTDRFPSIYTDLMQLRAEGRVASDSEKTKRSIPIGMSYFMLSRKVESGHREQLLGYVIAGNFDEAAKKMNLEKVEMQRVGSTVYLELVGKHGGKYVLEIFSEITGPVVD